MDLISDSKLLEFNNQGIIPGPDEDEASFLKRAEYCLSLKETIGSFLSESLPAFEEEASGKVIDEALPITKKFYDIAPTWIPLFFSNYNLSFWHGGCAWIFQKDENSPTSAFFQLRQNLRNQTHYLGIYDRNELIAHEMSHVGRMMFEEPQFEELLAYQSSPSRFRRWFGPLVQAPWESALFVLTIFLIFVIDLSVASYPQYYDKVIWLRAIPAAMLTYAASRLLTKFGTYRKCFDRLSRITSQPNAVIYRMTDAEIRLFSQMEPNDISKIVTEYSETSLRWRLNHLAYF